MGGGRADCDLEIIVPCYNVEKYVEECLNSILEQKTRFSYFVTVINDGSKDDTRNVLSKYECLTNVRIIDQTNKGLSSARNLGIAQAHGRYLLFVDSDDILIEGAIESLMTLAEKISADVVDSGHIRFADPITANGLRGRLRNFIYNVTAKPFVFKYCEDAKSISGYPWGKVIKTEIFQNVQFPCGYWYEDTLLWMIVEPLCKRKATIGNYTIRYRMNPNSITHKAYLSPKALDIIYVTLQLLKDRAELGIEMTQRNYDSLLYQVKLNTCQILRLPVEIQYAAFVVHRDIICNKFAKWTTDNNALRPIENYLRVNDYEGFHLWCEWH